jgi:hypothetical protein
VLLAACAPAPRPVQQAKADVTTETWYAPAAEQLSATARDAVSLWKQGRADEAGKIVTESQPLMNRLLAAPRPTLAVMRAASDLDELYGQMLMSNHRYGWARLQFQKNQVRWKAWRPETDESRHYLQAATRQIAECDRLLTEK